MSNYTLKPCPFCGGQGEMISYRDGILIRCSKCKISTGMIDANIDYCAKTVAVEKWNGRVEMDVDNSNKEKVKKIKNRNEMKIGNIVFRQGTEIYKCPRCDSYIRPNQNYCSECGQALDWSE